MNLFFIAGIGVAVFIEFLLLAKKRKSTSGLILTVWMFIIIVHLFLFTLFFSGDIHQLPFLLGMEHPLPLLHGVFLYYYVASVTGRLPRHRWIVLLHLLPAALMYGYLVSFFVLPAEVKIAVYRNRGEGYEWFSYAKLHAISISGIAYVIVSLLLLHRQEKTIRDNFSSAVYPAFPRLRLRFQLEIVVQPGIQERNRSNSLPILRIPLRRTAPAILVPSCRVALR